MNTESIIAICNLINQISVRNGWDPDNRNFTQMRVRQRMEELMSIMEIDEVVANKKLLVSPEEVTMDLVCDAIQILVYTQQHLIETFEIDVQARLAVVLSNLGIPKAGPIEL